MALKANKGISNRGVIPHGAGMLLTQEDAARIEAHAPIKPYRNGKDLTDKPRNVMVIDCYGLSIDEVRQRYPRLYQWLVDYVKPERDAHRDKDLREEWWLHRRNNEELRHALAGLPRYIATGQTAKYRIFQFLDANILPDDKLIAVALEDAYSLGVLSSAAHTNWALAAGGWMGVGNDPVYNKSKRFDAFPFPAASPEQQTRIAALAEQLDAHRERQQAAHPALTLTGMYNVLAKLRSGEVLSAKDKTIHEMGLVAVLRQLHDELDTAVLAAYGWSDLAPTASAALLDRLVALNLERAREEAAGHIRWLRPEFQNPSAAVNTEKQAKMDLPETSPSTLGPAVASMVATSPAKPTEKRPWPATLPEQVAAIAQALAANPAPLSEAEVAERFSGKGAWKKRLPQLLETLVALGRARKFDNQRYGASR